MFAQPAKRVELKLAQLDFDINHNPATIDIPDVSQITLGDLHGNAKNLFNKMLAFGVFKEIPDSTYDKFCQIYQKKPAEITQSDIDNMTAIIRSLALGKNRKLIRFIGDVLCDRGNQDYWTLLILNRMDDLEVPFEIIYSNHDHEFMMGFYNGTMSTPVLHEHQSRSLHHLNALRQRFPIMKSIKDIVNITFLHHMYILSYELRVIPGAKPRITVYTHAPVNLKTIANLALRLGFQPQSENLAEFNELEELMAAITFINDQFYKNPEAFISILSYELNQLIWQRAKNGEFIVEVLVNGIVEKVTEVDERGSINSEKRGYIVDMVHGHDSWQSLIPRVFNIDSMHAKDDSRPTLRYPFHLARGTPSYCYYSTKGRLDTIKQFLLRPENIVEDKIKDRIQQADSVGLVWCILFKAQLFHLYNKVESRINICVTAREMQQDCGDEFVNPWFWLAFSADNVECKKLFISFLERKIFPNQEALGKCQERTKLNTWNILIRRHIDIAKMILANGTLPRREDLAVCTVTTKVNAWYWILSDDEKVTIAPLLFENGIVPAREELLHRHYETGVNAFYWICCSKKRIDVLDTLFASDMPFLHEDFSDCFESEGVNAWFWMSLDPKKICDLFARGVMPTATDLSLTFKHSQKNAWYYFKQAGLNKDVDTILLTLANRGIMPPNDLIFHPGLAFEKRKAAQLNMVFLFLFSTIRNRSIHFSFQILSQSLYKMMEYVFPTVPFSQQALQSIEPEEDILFFVKLYLSTRFDHYQPAIAPERDQDNHVERAKDLQTAMRRADSMQDIYRLCSGQLYLLNNPGKNYVKGGCLAYHYAFFNVSRDNNFKSILLDGFRLTSPIKRPSA